MLHGINSDPKCSWALLLPRKRPEQPRPKGSIDHLHHLDHLLLFPLPPNHLHAHRNAGHFVRIVESASTYPMVVWATVQQFLQQGGPMTLADAWVCPLYRRCVRLPYVRDGHDTNGAINHVVQQGGGIQQGGGSK